MLSLAFTAQIIDLVDIYKWVKENISVMHLNYCKTVTEAGLGYSDLSELWFLSLMTSFLD